jgi:hypothetical protein
MSDLGAPIEPAGPSADPESERVPAADLRATGPQVDTALETLRSELARVDGKASLLLALTGAGLAALVATATSIHPPVGVLVLGTVGAAVLLAATVLLLLAVRPRLGSAGWPTWHALEAEALHREVGHGQHLAEVQVLATSARAKYIQVRIAIDLVLAAFVPLSAAALLGLAR